MSPAARERAASGGGAALLEVSRVRRVFGGIVALDDVSFAVERGAAVGLIGPNGAGKTTLFNLLTGVERPSAGAILLDGTRIDGVAPHRIARLGVGRTFQSVRAFGDLTVRDNLRIALMSAPRDDSGESDARILAALEQADMAAHVDADAGLLSYGQRKLVELAMVLVQSPRLILLDEPVAGVSPAITAKIAAILASLVAQGRTLVIVEHNIGFVTSLCTRVIVMANGAVLADGRPETVRDDPRVLEAFLGGR